MIGKLAWLVSPDPGRYVLNFQIAGTGENLAIEISPDHMRNIILDGTAHWMRNSFHRVPTTSTEGANGDDRRQQPA